jgi:antitoxin HigA-1
MATITRKAAHMHKAVHPGEVLKELYLEPLGVTLTEAAEALQVSRKHVSAIVNGRAPITPDMALRLSVVFSTEPDVWVNLQARYDIWRLHQQKPLKLKPLRVAA